MKKYATPELELYIFNQTDVLEGSGETVWHDPDPNFNGTDYYDGPELP